MNMFSKRGGKVQRLRDVPLFGMCTDAELADIAALVDEVQLGAGTLLTREGTLGRECFVIVTGSVRVEMHGEDLGTRGPGEVVGEMALLDSSPRAATVRAVTDVEALALDPRSFSELLTRHPSVGKRMLAAMAQRLRTAENAPTGC